MKKLGPCTAQLTNGSLIDLSSLDRPKSPRLEINSDHCLIISIFIISWFFKSKSESDMGDYKYFFNPCSPIECTAESEDAAVI